MARAQKDLSILSTALSNFTTAAANSFAIYVCQANESPLDGAPLHISLFSVYSEISKHMEFCQREGIMMLLD